MQITQFIIKETLADIQPRKDYFSVTILISIVLVIGYLSFVLIFICYVFNVQYCSVYFYFSYVLFDLFINKQYLGLEI